MAATQAESQQNDVKLNESVKCAQKRTQVGGANSASASAKQQLDSEPDDKVSRGAAQLLKYVNRGGGGGDTTTGYEMSQYREDIGGHGAAGEVKSPREAPQEPVGKQEAHDAPGHPGAHPGHPFAPNVIRDYADEYSNNKSAGEPFAASKSLADYPPGKQLPEYVTKHADFPGPGKQLDYGKHLMHESERAHRAEMEEHYSGSKIESRLGYVGASPANFSAQPRFLTGQGISQTAGPTPTLNQLLQATTPSMHRFHGNYPGMGSEPYQQPWPMQRPPVVPPVYPQPSQRPPQTVNPHLYLLCIFVSCATKICPFFSVIFIVTNRIIAMVPFTNLCLTCTILTRLFAFQIDRVRRDYTQGQEDRVLRQLCSINNMPNDIPLLRDLMHLIVIIR